MKKERKRYDVIIRGCLLCVVQDVKRFESKSEPEVKKGKNNKLLPVEVEIPEGKGETLDSMPEVMKNFANESDQDLKVIFGVLFGHKKCKLGNLRKTLKKWKGWNVEINSKKHHLLQEGVGSLTSDNLKWMMGCLNVEKKGISKKDKLVDRLCEWCLDPKKEIKGRPNPTKGRPNAKRKEKSDANQNDTNM
jgi:hypothetical protein